jgi:hypothetical protein
VMITRPLRTATPERAMKLIPALMDSGIPLSRVRRHLRSGQGHAAEDQQCVGH